jgi:hypothetical protein
LFGFSVFVCASGNGAHHEMLGVAEEVVIFYGSRRYLKSINDITNLMVNMTKYCSELIL